VRYISTFLLVNGSTISVLQMAMDMID